MEISASANTIRISPRKVRAVAEVIKTLPPKLALAKLMLMPRRAAVPLAKVLKSAIANAEHNGKLTVENLMVKAILVGEGSSLKRWRPVSRGRAHAYKKRTSSIRIVLTGNTQKIPALLGEGKGEEKGEKRGAKS
jgi:large subunit ribosomal protein L22